MNLNCNSVASDRDDQIEAIARFQTAVNVSIDLNKNFVLKLSSVSVLENDAWTNPKDKVIQFIAITFICI